MMRDNCRPVRSSCPGMPSIAPDFATALYDTLPFPVVLVNGAAEAIGFNIAGRRAFGLGGEAAATGPVIEGVGGAALRTLSGMGRETTHILRFRRLDGSTFEATAHVLSLGSGGGAEGYAILLRSLVTGGSHGENLILGNRISSALDTIPEGFAIFGRDERLVMFNKAFRDRCGPARHAVRVGVSLESIVRENIRMGVYTDIAEGTPEAEDWVAARLADHRNLDAGGAVFRFGDGRWMRSESHVTADGDIVALRLDITKVKRAEMALDAKQREYLSLLQNMPDMICRYRPDWTILFVNDNYAALYGRPAADLIGSDVLMLVPPHERERATELQASFTPDDPFREHEVLHVRPDGCKVWVLWSVVAIYNGNRLVEFVGAGRDITETKVQQQHIIEQTAELQRKNEALDQFTATVSHDLKAPLRHIAMFSEMLTDDVQRGVFDELESHTGHIRKSIGRMQRLVESLLDYSQIAYRIGRLERVHLRAVVDEAMQLLETHLRETDAAVTIGELPEMEGDPELLKRLAQNLIGNALKYRRPGTRPVVRLYGASVEQGVTFVVEDEGIGVDSKFGNKIFDVFQRLHRDETVYPGTGIGLALAKRIVESHDGVIALDTAYQQGARFVVTFPHTPSVTGERPWETRRKS